MGCRNRITNVNFSCCANWPSEGGNLRLPGLLRMYSIPFQLPPITAPTLPEKPPRIPADMVPIKFRFKSETIKMPLLHALRANCMYTGMTRFYKRHQFPMHCSRPLFCVGLRIDCVGLPMILDSPTQKNNWKLRGK